MTIHEIALTGYRAVYTDGKFLHLGTKDSYGNEQLHLTLDDTWSELAITATFTNANEESVTVPMEAGNLVTVPPEAAAAATSRFRPASVILNDVREISGDDLHAIRGTDYWTEVDKAEMVDAVLAALPAAEEASF